MVSTYSFLNTSISTIFLLTLIPTLIWINLMRKKNAEDKKEVSKALLLGLVIALPVMALEFLWLSSADIETYMKLGEPRSLILFTAIAAGFLAEFGKFFVLANLKRWKVKIDYINEAIVLILATSLGFAFIENISYFLKLADSGRFYELYQDFVCRSLLVTIAHMLFAGITAYYYMIGKFGNPIVAMDASIGKKHPIAQFLEKKFKIKASKTYKISHIIFGLLLASLLHGSFNGVLLSDRLWLASLILLSTFLFVIHLSRKRISHLVFTSAERSKLSKIKKKERDIIIDLIGNWIKEKKYHHVIELCDRLLIKHPGNTLLKVIKARAIDRKRAEGIKNALKRFLGIGKWEEIETPPEKYKNRDTRTIKKENLPKKKGGLGLVLGGGGMRACLHLGFYQVLQENNIEVDYITGTSGGAMIGAPLALGQDTEEIKHKIQAQKNLKFSWDDFNYFEESIIGHDFLKYGVELVCEGKSFYDLKKPFACAAVDLESGEEIVFTDGALEPAVAASASLPMVFPPVYYRKHYLVDGGVKDILPMTACRKLGADKIIAVLIKSYKTRQNIAGEIFAKYHDLKNVVSKENKKGLIKRLLSKKKHDLTNFVNIITRVISIASQCCDRQELKRGKPDLLIEVKCDLDLFEFDKIDEIIEVGRKAALDNLDKIKALLKDK